MSTVVQITTVRGVGDSGHSGWFTDKSAYIHQLFLKNGVGALNSHRTDMENDSNYKL